MFVIKSDSKRYSALTATLQNAFISGHNHYPQTLNMAYNMLVNYVNPNRDRTLDLQDGGLLYMATEETEGGHEHWQGCGRGRDGQWTWGGHYPHGRGRFQDELHETHSLHKQHPDSEDVEGGNNHTSNDVAHYLSTVLTSSHGETHIAETGRLPTTWILLNIGSTTNIISNKSLLHAIHDSTEPIWIGSLGSQIKLTQKGLLGNYPYPVWYNPNGIANILSLFNVAKAYRVTMDTMHGRTLQVHINDQSTIDFAPTTNGLWMYQLNNPQSVQHMWSVSTVDNQKKLYTKRAYKHVVLARKIQTIIMQPLTQSYQDVIIDHMTDCPVTKADIQAAEKMFGPNLGSLKGKTEMTTLPQGWMLYPTK
jgi:hypothetical protein